MRDRRVRFMAHLELAPERLLRESRSMMGRETRDRKGKLPYIDNIL